MLEIWRAEPHAEDRVKAAEQLFDHPVDLQATRRFLAEGVNELLIAYADGEPAGFVSATARVASEAAMTVRYPTTERSLRRLQHQFERRDAGPR